jgi:hypothetical protein
MARNEKSPDFCLTLMNRMEDRRRNPGSRLLKLGKIQGLDPRLLPTVNINTGGKQDEGDPRWT